MNTPSWSRLCVPLLLAASVSCSDNNSAEQSNNGTDDPCLAAFVCGESETAPAALRAPILYRVETVLGAIEDADRMHLFSSAIAVNTSGTMVGELAIETQDGVFQGTYTMDGAGEITPLDDLPEGTVWTDINDRGDLVGWVGQQDGASALVSSGGDVVDIGAKFEGGDTLGSAINNDGHVAGLCETEGNVSPCFWTAEQDWSELPAFGEAVGIADDGTVVGISQELSGMLSGFLWREGDGLTSLSVRDRHPSLAVGISTNGRWAAFNRAAPALASPEQAWIRDLKTGAYRLVDDLDGHPWIHSGTRVTSVNDAGVVIGQGFDMVRGPRVFVYDPRTGQSLDLGDRLEDGDQYSIIAANALSNGGHVAGSVIDPNFMFTGARFTPIDGPDFTEVALPQVDEQALYTPHRIERSAFGAPNIRHSFAVGFGANNLMLVHIDEPDSEAPVQWLYRAAWADSEGGVAAIGEPGSWLPSRVAPGGRQVGTMLAAASTGPTVIRAATATSGAIAAIPGLPARVESYGIDADASGRILAECVTDSTREVCTWDEDDEWQMLFEGRAFAISDAGTIAGATEDDAVYWRDGELVELGIGPGARALAISPDGRYIAGDAEHAFVYDTEEGLIDWLPDLYGDPATIGRVEPRAVSDDGVVVGVAFDSVGEPFAFRYDALAGEMLRLDSIVPGDERIVDARAISSSGWIAATALRVDDAFVALALEPVE